MLYSCPVRKPKPTTYLDAPNLTAAAPAVVVVKVKKVRIKVSSNSLKLGTVVVHAKLIFLYFQVSAKQNCYGFTRGDYLELFPGFPGNSGNRGNPTRGDLPARGDLPCRVSVKRGSREATSLYSSDE